MNFFRYGRVSMNINYENLNFFGIAFEGCENLDFTTDFLAGVRANYFNNRNILKPDSSFANVKGMRYTYSYNIRNGIDMDWKLYRKYERGFSSTKGELLQKSTLIDLHTYSIDSLSKLGFVSKKQYFDLSHKWIKTEYFKNAENAAYCVISPAENKEGNVLEKKMNINNTHTVEYLYPTYDMPENNKYEILAYTDKGFVYYTQSADKNDYNVVSDEDDVEKTENMKGFNFRIEDFTIQNSEPYDLRNSPYFDGSVIVDFAEEFIDIPKVILTPDNMDADNKTEILSNIDENEASDINIDRTQDMLDQLENLASILDFSEFDDISIMDDPEPEFNKETEVSVDEDSEGKNITNEESEGNEITDVSDEDTEDNEITDVTDEDSDEYVITDVTDGDNTDEFNDFDEFPDLEDSFEKTQLMLDEINQLSKLKQEKIETEETSPFIQQEESAECETITDLIKSEEKPDHVIDSRGEQYNFYGKIIDGKRQGHGRTATVEGITAYEGNFVDDKRNGFGAFYYKNGDINYLGNWENNKRQGFGVGFRNSDFTAHIGKWNENAPEGVGARFDNEGNFLFLGNYIEGKKQGFGITTDNDGNFVVSKFKDDEVITSFALDDIFPGIE